MNYKSYREIGPARRSGNHVDCASQNDGDEELGSNSFPNRRYNSVPFENQHASSAMNHFENYQNFGNLSANREFDERTPRQWEKPQFLAAEKKRMSDPCFESEFRPNYNQNANGRETFSEFGADLDKNSDFHTSRAHSDFAFHNVSTGQANHGYRPSTGMSSGGPHFLNASGDRVDGGYRNPNFTHHPSSENNMYHTTNFGNEGNRFPHVYGVSPCSNETYQLSDVSLPSEMSTSHRFRRESTPREDLNVRIKNYDPKQCDWLDYREYVIQIGNRAHWSDNTKIVKLLAALDSGMLSVTAGLPLDYTFNELLQKIDSISGVQFAKRNATTQLSYVKKREGESVSVYAERVRSLTGRAFRGYAPHQIDELALRAYIEGLPNRQNLRVLMKTQNFQTLQEAICYAANFDQILTEEKHYANGRATDIEEYDYDGGFCPTNDMWCDTPN